MLISSDYAEQNRKLHETRDDYGAKSYKWAPYVVGVADALKCRSVLDYGCGKGSLGKKLSDIYRWQDYDPAIPSSSTPPVQSDLVVCTDVMEHIEPDCLVSVLDHIQMLALKGVFINVATRPAQKTLPDGRNAHLIVKSASWWLALFEERFATKKIGGDGSGLYFVGVPK